jgi:hypothetical protein
MSIPDLQPLQLGRSSTLQCAAGSPLDNNGYAADIGWDVCDKHLPHAADKPAIIYEREESQIDIFTFRRLAADSDRLVCC